MFKSLILFFILLKKIETEDILRIVVFSYTMKVCLVTNILQNIFFVCVCFAEESHTGLDWHEGE